MNPVTSMIFRRMRLPVILLILAYAVSVLGLVLIPGVDDQGEPWRMSFFHAFYLVSFTATTIGFGEIPYTLTDAQRLWTLLAIYTTVIAWFYGLGTILSLVQNRDFKEAVSRFRFEREIRRMHRPFYLVCGFGETGNAVVRNLISEHHLAVVIDIDRDNLSELKLNELPMHVPSLAGDASHPDQLSLAGIQHSLCRGVIAVTPSDAVNLQIAITSKLLHPDIRVVCRSEVKSFEDNMLSFGTDHIVNPYETFASIFAMAMKSPALYLIYDWLTGAPNTRISEPVHFKEGRWILCGYGRFGKELFRRLRDHDIPTTVIDPSERAQQEFYDLCDDEIHEFILGDGTDEASLRLAGAERAAGLIAGSDNDSNNLSSIMTARDINANIFVVARQNSLYNEPLYVATEADICMRPREIIARKIRMLFMMPLLLEYLNLAQRQGTDWANLTISRLSAVVGESRPTLWTLSIDHDMTPAIAQGLEYGRTITMAHLISDPAVRNQRLKCVPLLLLRKGQPILMPDDDIEMSPDDRILMCGARDAHNSMDWTLRVMSSLNYVMAMDDEPESWVWRKLHRRTHRIERRTQPR